MRVGAVGVGAILAFAVLGCTRRPPNVLLISIDSLRADHVGAYGYTRDTTPTIDRLAAHGIRFETAISSTSWTLPAHAALFTALPDLAHGVSAPTDSLGEGIPTLAEAMKAGGYRTLGFYSGPFLHPLFGLDRGFDVYRDCTSYDASGSLDGETRGEKEGTRAVQRLHARSHKDVTNPKIAERFAAEIESLENQPFFAFVHMWDVHYDYIPPPEYARMFSPDYTGTVTGEGFRMNEAVHKGMPAEDLARIIALYDGEIRYTDDTVAQLLATLQSRGFLENTLVVITADHGEEFFEHGGKGHRHTLFDEVTRIPLIFHHPRLTPYAAVSTQVVSITDIANTILELSRQPRLANTTGRSLVPLWRRRSPPWQDRPALASLRAGASLSLDALRGPDAKIIHDLARKKHSFFNLTNDPNEQRAIDPQGSRVAEAMADALARRTAAAQATGRTIGGGARAKIDPATLEALRSLGYVDTSGGSPDSGGSPQ